MKQACVRVAMVCGAVGMMWLLPTMMASRLYAQAQQPVENRQNGQPPTQSGQNPPKGKIVLVEPNTKISSFEQAQLVILGMQMEIKALQEQVQTLQSQAPAAQASQQALQNSLQNLQEQYAHHSHSLTQTQPGHRCTYVSTFMLTDAGGHQVQAPLEVGQSCPGHPEWNGFNPNYTSTSYVSTPVTAPK